MAYALNNVGRKISADPYPVFGAGEDTGVQQITIRNKTNYLLSRYNKYT